ncbi:TPA: type II/IV secretion system ATPase subunit [Candidatus Woesearchaeota archaeon]|nr:type II/IV secretion system ATPase subunit [Candidatus Woesearchaeota archaeon]HIH54826.1 type II/IV secretion system ATPase subunit [Candidatus Woesearchaeota archaeon]HIJ13663.1 type II/IV secretion system ATPase subunit [Candidatus Woesearchaeota archaeon]
MLFNNQGISYDISHEGEETILRLDYENAMEVPSLEDSENCMSDTVDKLVSNRNVTKIVFSQKRDYEYEFNQTRLLVEIARAYAHLIKQKALFNYESLSLHQSNPVITKMASEKYAELQNIIFNKLKRDPLGTYMELRRIIRKEKIEVDKSLDNAYSNMLERYVQVLSYIIKLLEETKLISLSKNIASGMEIGDRSIYRRIFTPNIKPDFMFTKYMAAYPKNAEEIDSYTAKGSEVIVFKLKHNVQNLYHITPPEFRLEEEKYEILDLARKIMSEHKPEKQEFVDPARMREVFIAVGRDLIEELAEYKNVKLKNAEVEELARILVRYTVGFGIVEALLEDEKIQDITINSPLGNIPAFIVHQDYDYCRTNLVPTLRDAESWASKLRMLSGRPLDEANPVLDTEILIPGTANARVGVIGQPLNPTGLAYAFRRHRDKPWTFGLFIQNRMMNAQAAGLLSFFIDGARTMLVAGTRSAGKSSLLGSIMVEVMRKYRIISIEDTLELPGVSLRKLGYNIQQMKVSSALSKNSSEVSAEEGIRTTLRMGDSCLFVGEVRSTEAKSLYEAMRVGALANVVAGTIHGDSPYGVYDRVVNDLGVPKTSFKATDLIVVANPIRSADGLHRWRRITQITEVRKLWENDPIQEKGFVDLMKYNSKSDQLEISEDLMNQDSDVIKSIAENVKEWAGNWDAVWENIMLRAKNYQTLVDVSKKLNNPELLEARFAVEANDQFHKISDKIKEETGSYDSKRIFFEWNDWLKREAKALKSGK